MERIKLVLNPYQNINKVYLNDNSISRYSKLNQLVHDDLVQWAMSFFREAEEEMNGDYTLTVCGEQFEKELLNAISCEFECCTGFNEEKYQVNIPIAERWTKLVQIAEKTGVNIDDCLKIIPVYSDIEMISTDYFEFVSKKDAMLAFQSSVLDDDAALEEEATITFVYGNKNKVEENSRGNYIWRFDNISTAKKNFLEAVEYFSLIPSIDKATRKIINSASKIEPEDIENLEMIHDIDVRLKVEQIPKILVNDTYEPNIYSTLDKFEIPQICMESLNTGVIEIHGSSLYAVGEGRAIIRFFVKGESVPFAETEVCAYLDNCVKRIELHADYQVLKVGESVPVMAEIYPVNADDKDQCFWSSDPVDIGIVTDDGILMALNYGTVSVRYSSPNVTASLDFEVLPIVEKITLSQSQIHLYVGDVEYVEIMLSPEGVYESELCWSSSDSDVVTIESMKSGINVCGNCVGECTLYCKDSDSDAEAQLHVIVESTFEKRGVDYTISESEKITSADVSKFFGDVKNAIGKKVKVANEIRKDLKEEKPEQKENDESNFRDATEKSYSDGVIDSEKEENVDLGTKEKVAQIADFFDQKAKKILGGGLIYQSVKDGGRSINKFRKYAKGVVDKQIKKAVDYTYDGLINKKNDKDGNVTDSTEKNKNEGE